MAHSSIHKYRHDIDGLRAVAVIAVVIFHAFPNWLKGGFIGVDVFFVLSGYLVSGIIWEDLYKGTFSFTQFYSRRIRRIYPALLLVLIVAYFLGWFALFADEYKELSKHIASGVTCISNFVLWSEAGYFDKAGDTKLMLHLWSLGVEEQFYILWPLLSWLAYKNRLHSSILLLLFLVVSFFLNIKAADSEVIADFFSPQTRFWELLSGSLIAWFEVNKQRLYDFLDQRKKQMTNNVDRGKYESKLAIFANSASIIGFCLLAFSFLKIGNGVVFPGKWALIPVLGTVLIICSGSRAWINRILLSNRVLVWFGLISYPLYLWHWPLLTFARIVESEVPSKTIRVGAVLLSIGLSWLTFHFVEKPIRFGPAPKLKAAALVVLSVIIGGLGYFTYRKNGFPSRLPNYVAPISTKDSFQTDGNPYSNCTAAMPYWREEIDGSCRFQQKRGNSIAIIGDSHGAQLYQGLSELGGATDGMINFMSGCAAPYIDLSSGLNMHPVQTVKIDKHKLIKNAFEFILNNPSIKTVILAHNPICSYPNRVKDLSNPTISDPNQIIENGMRRTFSSLLRSQKRVIVVLNFPTLPYDPELCIARPFRITNHGNKCRLPRTFLDASRAYSDYKSVLTSVIKDYPEIRTYDFSQFLCDDKYCYVAKDGVLLYGDRNHLNENGSRFVAPSIMKAIRALEY